MSSKLSSGWPCYMAFWASSTKQMSHSGKAYRVCQGLCHRIANDLSQQFP